MSALKRILNKDIKSIQEQNLKNLGIYIEFNEENLYCAKALIKTLIPYFSSKALTVPITMNSVFFCLIIGENTFVSIPNGI